MEEDLEAKTRSNKILPERHPGVSKSNSVFEKANRQSHDAHGPRKAQAT